MKDCCKELTTEAFADYLKEHSGSQSFLENRLDQLRVLHPHLWSLFFGFADIRVANRRGSEARATYTECLKCGQIATLVIVSAPLLLLIWRTSQLFTRLVVRWDLMGEKVQVEVRNPTDDEQAEYKRMLDDYMGVGIVEPLDLGAHLEVRKDALSVWSDALFAAVDLAQIWVIAHEVSHAISMDILSKAIPELAAIREGSRRFTEELDLSPKQAKLWANEFDADLTGLFLVYNSETSRRHDNREVSILVRESVGAHLAAALGLAYEAFWQIDRWDADKAESVTQTHPPVHLRWKVASNYLKQIVEPRPGVDLDYLAQILGRVSRRFLPLQA